MCLTEIAVIAFPVGEFRRAVVVVFHDDDAGGDAVDKITVMTDDDERADKFFEGFLQRFD